jgi:hypothetical protein
VNEVDPIPGASLRLHPYAPWAESPRTDGTKDDDPWADADRLRAAHLRIAWSGFLASVMTVVVGCALYLVQ